MTEHIDAGSPAYLDQIERFNPRIRDHADHAWRQVGRCVYCECGQRLYQGRKPDDHPTFTPGVTAPP